MDKIADILRVFLEKYFLPTIIAIPITIAFVAIFPDILSIQTKTSFPLYILMNFCIIFILVLGFLNCFKSIRGKRVAIENKAYERKSKKEAIEVTLRKVWNYVDGLSIEDKKVLFQFLSTGNQPIESNSWYSSESVFNNTTIMNSSIVEHHEDRRVRHINSEFAKEGHIIMQPIGLAPNYGTKKRYKLTDEFYTVLKYSYDKYHRISNFKEDNQYDKA